MTAGSVHVFSQISKAINDITSAQRRCRGLRWELQGTSLVASRHPAPLVLPCSTVRLLPVSGELARTEARVGTMQTGRSTWKLWTRHTHGGVARMTNAVTPVPDWASTQGQATAPAHHLPVALDAHTSLAGCWTAMMVCPTPVCLRRPEKVDAPAPTTESAELLVLSGCQGPTTRVAAACSYPCCPATQDACHVMLGGRVRSMPGVQGGGRRHVQTRVE